ncbi:MAG TPA: AAA family ATPase [Burkholderiales bacterium]|nr:AAA family ATPase [Burkholderiales bacterium]
MYLDHFGLSEPPFRITPNTEFFFQGANRGATLEALVYAISQDEGIVKVSGEVGSGKTMLCRVLMERLPKNVETVFLANPSLSADEILLAIADELGFEMGELRSARLLRALQDRLIALFADGRRVVVLIDEAHAMPKPTLEEIRLLSNLEANRHKLLQIVLFGQPELDDLLDTGDMRQLKERITHSFRLDPLRRPDVESYVEFRMRAAGYRGPNVFTRQALELIAQASHGLTRRVNILADKALLAAFASGSHAVGAREVRRAIGDSNFYRPARRFGRIAAAIGALAAALGVGWTLHALLSDSGRADPPPGVRAAVGPAMAAAAQPPAAAAPQSTAPQPTPAPDPAVPVAAGSSNPKVTKRAKLSVTGDEAPARQEATAVPLWRDRLAATQNLLEAAPGERQAIQLLTVDAGDTQDLENFLLKAAKVVPADELLVYSVKFGGKQHYRVAFGSYADAREALAAANGLPPLLRAQGPYPRSFERMRSQNRQ